MRLVLIILVGIGLLAAVSAALLVKALTASNQPLVASASAAETQILVAARPLPAMSVIDGGAVVMKKVARSAAPGGAVTDPVQVVGKVLTVPMVEGETFSEANFAKKGSGVHLAAALPTGKRAVSVSLTDHTGMVGLLYPGSVVDVMVAVQMKIKWAGQTENEDETVNRTLLQGVQVLAVGFDSVTAERGARAEPTAADNGGAADAGKPGRGDQRMVTLLVEPKQAQALQLAMQKGTISLALRNPMDQQVVIAGSTRIRDLVGALGLGGGEPEPVASSLRDAWNALQDRLAAGLPNPQAVAEAKPAPAADPFESGTPAPGKWEVEILRGKESEVRTFPMPEKRVVSMGPAAAAQN